MHGRCAHGAGYQAEVFQPAQPHFQRFADEAVPIFASLRFYQHASAGAVDFADAARGDADDQPAEIGCEHDVAAAAQPADIVAVKLRERADFRQRFGVQEFGVMRGGYGQPERGVWGEVVSVSEGEHGFQAACKQKRGIIVD